MLVDRIILNNGSERHTSADTLVLVLIPRHAFLRVARDRPMRALYEKPTTCQIESVELSAPIRS